MNPIDLIWKASTTLSLRPFLLIFLALFFVSPLTPITLSFAHEEAPSNILALNIPLINNARSEFPGNSNPCGAPCRNPQRAEKEIIEITKRAMKQYDLKAVILRVLVDRKNLVTAALGESMTGVPANARMHWRNGNIAISYLATVLLQLKDEGRLTLEDKLSRWFPDLPNSNQVTLRMLVNSTSGYPDYVRNESFVEAFYDNVFRQWSFQELLEITFSEPVHCDPGTCFQYSHFNFILLGEVLSQVAGKPLKKLIRNRVLRPLGMRNTESQDTPVIREPVLHAFTAERDIYEDSSFWNPSWTLARGAIMTTNVIDAARAARAVGTGKLVSQEAFQEMLAPLTADFPPWNSERYYGLGVQVYNGWINQMPLFHGYSAVAGYLPSKKLTIVVTSTNGITARPGLNYSDLLFKLIANYVNPEHPFPTDP